MPRSSLVTIALGVATSVAMLQGARAGSQAPATTPGPAGTSAVQPATQTPAPAKADGMAGGHLQLPDQLTWTEPPPALPRGAQAAVLHGDPGAKTGMFVVRLKMPAGYKVMPHTHPTAESVTVLNGELRVGMGRTWDDASMKPLPRGGFAYMPADTAHYVQARGEATIQVSGQAPFTLTYVNPGDDPRKAAPTSTRR